MKKRNLNLIFFGLIFSIFMISMTNFASAQGFADTFNGIITEAIKTVEPTLKILVGDISAVSAIIGETIYTFSEADIFFAKVLLLLLFIAIVYAIAVNIEFLEDNVWALWAVSLIIPILSVRFLSGGIIQAMILPYTAFGIALSVIIPLAIAFYVLEIKLSISGWGKVTLFEWSIFVKVCWIFLGLIYLFLGYSRWDQIGDSIWLYWASIIAIAIVILMENRIRIWLNEVRSRKISSTQMTQLYEDLGFWQKAVSNTYAGIEKSYWGWWTSGGRLGSGQGENYINNVFAKGLKGRAAYEKTMKELEKMQNDLLKFGLR